VIDAHGLKVRYSDVFDSKRRAAFVFDSKALELVNRSAAGCSGQIPIKQNFSGQAFLGDISPSRLRVKSGKG
jgi:hypothetical protein